MDTKLEICNAALILGGEKPLLDLFNKSDPRVLAIDGLYDITLDGLLRQHPWNCAIHRKKIGADDEKPDFGFSYKYPLPSDPYCLRALKINNDLSAAWKVEGRFLLTDETECLLEYIKRITNPAEMDSLLKKAFISTLAWETSKKITGADESVVINLYKISQSELAEARLADWKESSGEAIQIDTLTGFRQ